MGGENCVPYNEGTARDIVRSGDFRDYDGNIIGTEKNWIDASIDLAAKQVKNAAYEYMAVTYCATNDISENTIITSKYLKHLVDKIIPSV